ncbi:MAG: hypothetical protein ACI83D_000155 [Planctomycetota bacterium]|jgi:hypothetical protein
MGRISMYVKRGSMHLEVGPRDIELGHQKRPGEVFSTDLIPQPLLLVQIGECIRCIFGGEDSDKDN